MRYRKIRLSVVFDVLPDQETAVKNAVEQWLKSSFGVNRIATHRKEIVFHKGGERT